MIGPTVFAMSAFGAKADIMYACRHVR